MASVTNTNLPGHVHICMITVIAVILKLALSRVGCGTCLGSRGSLAMGLVGWESGECGGLGSRILWVSSLIRDEQRRPFCRR